MLLCSSAPIHAEQADLTELYTGIRETTVRYIALGTPDDLIRLQDAFDKTERELARFQIEVPPEGSAQFAEKQQSLKELKDRLTESKAFLQLLDRSDEKTPVAQLQVLSPEERSLIRGQFLGRIEALQETIGSVKEAIRSEEAAYILILIDERKGLANLRATRRVELLTEYSTWSKCQVADRPCLHQQLLVLCHLKLLSSGAERLPILRLIAEVDSRLNAGGQTEPTSCENL
jgi:hypothetical protein